MAGKKSTSRTKKILEEEPTYSTNTYQSLIFGVISVFVIFLVALIGYRLLFQRPNSEISKEAVNTESESEVSISPNEYTVKEGDTLWSISEDKYKSGYNWVDIAKENNISNPGIIEKGLKLRIPEVEAKTLTITITPEKTTQESVSQTNKIEGNSYVVSTGDYLWDIAVRAYGDGYKWVDISRENKLDNPDVIHSGNKLTIPR